MKHIVSFSGGKDSTAMLLMMIEKDMQINEIIFCDTGVEFPGMYDHIEKVKKFTGKEITVLKYKYSFEYLLGEHIKTRGKNKGKIGYGWPDFKNRWCTFRLKTHPFQTYLKNKKEKFIEYHGIAKDEEDRSKKNKYLKSDIRYPLIDWNVTESQALQYCYEKGFNWGGLYEKFGRTSCYCCPLSRLSELRTLYREFPDLWAKLKEMDKKSFRKFRSDYSIEQLEDKFKYCIY